MQKTKLSYELGIKRACFELGIKSAKASDFISEAMGALKPMAAEGPHPLVGKSINLHSLVNKGPNPVVPTNFANSPNLKGKTIAIKSLANKNASVVGTGLGTAAGGLAGQGLADIINEVAKKEVVNPKVVGAAGLGLGAMAGHSATKHKK
jgi:hypothetical protein